VADVLGPASLALSSSIGSFQFFLPRLSDVRKADMTVDADMVGDVRLGEIAAIAMCTAVGAIGSSLSGSIVPMVVSGLVAAVLVCVYESALRGDRPGNPKSVATYVRSGDA
jgi:hypothetical protein